MDLLAALNSVQREAASTIDGPVLILAGAGSGKTRVLTYRIAHLVKELGIPPWNVLAITFTNKAASEMKERVNLLLGDRTGEMVWVSTFHAACVRILRSELSKIGKSSLFTIYDGDDQKKLIKAVLKELDIDEKHFPVNAILSQISDAKNKLLTPKDYEMRAGSFFENQVAKVYHLYQDKLNRSSAMDFDDLLMQCVFLLRDNPSILKYYQDKFQYIHIDEYQDTNHVQYQLGRLLASKNQNICVVGDDDQSIYGWRGADIGNILDFEKDYPAARVFKLVQNYRSTRSILSAANAVIENNWERKGKELWTDNEEGDKAILYRASNDFAEAMFICTEIEKLHQEEQLPYSSFAVMYRTNSQSRILEESLLKFSIPYQLIGGFRFYQRAEVKDIMSYLKVLVNPDDGISLKRIINIPRRGIGDSTISRIEKYAIENDLSMWQALDVSPDIMMQVYGNRAFKPMSIFLALMKELMGMRVNMILPDIVEAIIDKTGYSMELVTEGTEESMSRLENLRELISVARDFHNRSEDKSLEAFLYDVSLLADTDSIEDDVHKVTLITLHGAKGLEYPVVFLTGLEDGVFPHMRCFENDREMQEERRLCYVGITRAKKKLYLTLAGSRMQAGQDMYNPPSRFLKEIPGSLVLDRSTFAQRKEVQTVSNIKPAARPQQEKPQLSEDRYNIKTGEKVRHSKWGVGTVVSVKGSGANMEIAVAFSGSGVKKLLVEYAPVEKVDA